MTPPRVAAPHVQAALSRTAQARLSAPAPGRPSAPRVQAPHVQAKIAAVQAKIAPPPVARPMAAHVQAKLAAPPVRPPAPHLPPPLRLPAPPARPAAAQAKAIAPPPVPRPPAPPPPAVSRPSALLAPLPTRPVTAAIQRSAVIQPATRVSYFTSAYAARARRKRREGGVGGRNLATVCYQIQNVDGSWRARKYKTMPSSGEHSEKRLYDYLEGLGYVYRVRWVYTELAPCGSDYHNCAQRLENWWPDADVYYSVDYPSVDDVSSESSDSDEDSGTKKRNKAKRRRKRGPAILKRFETYSKKNDSDSDDAPDPSDFKPGLQHIYSPVHYSSGWDL